LRDAATDAAFENPSVRLVPTGPTRGTVVKDDAPGLSWETAKEEDHD
jgi:hypothetical protein